MTVYRGCKLCTSQCVPIIKFHLSPVLFGFAIENTTPKQRTMQLYRLLVYDIPGVLYNNECF